MTQLILFFFLLINISFASGASFKATNQNNLAADKIKQIIKEIQRRALAEKELKNNPKAPVYEPEVDVEELASQSYNHLLEGLSEESFSEVLHYNLGLSFEANLAKSKAIKQYKSVVKMTSDPRLKFNSLFNMARLYANAKNKEKALEYYQKALAEEPPKELEKQVKINIELLMQDSSGKGKGQSEDDKKKNPGKGDKEAEKKEKGKEDEDKKKPVQSRRNNHPQPFKGKELTKNDVRKILEELKNQEQKIRAKDNRRKGKERPRGKDW